MKKQLAYALLFLFSTAGLKAQSVATTVNFNKTDRPALLLLIPFKETIAEGAIVDNLKKTGYDPQTKGSLFWKNNKSNGFLFYKGVTLNNQVVDLYFKIDPAGTSKDEQSNIYLLVSKGEERFVSSESDPTLYNAAQVFLNNFVAQTASYKLNKDIDAQEASLKEAEKKLSGLQNEEKDLEKKLQQLQEDLKKNKTLQENQQKVIENNKSKLLELKMKSA
ncbi:MAG TPA: hypothetical protein VHK91_04080 [Flavisolibacter sp.]|jgi:valyl-tRNA synthetase|nr:hypothetical protein [Flavisolibacter sp.]